MIDYQTFDECLSESAQALERISTIVLQHLYTDARLFLRGIALVVAGQQSSSARRRASDLMLRHVWTFILRLSVSHARSNEIFKS